MVPLQCFNSMDTSIGFVYEESSIFPFKYLIFLVVMPLFVRTYRLVVLVEEHTWHIMRWWMKCMWDVDMMRFCMVCMGMCYKMTMVVEVLRCMFLISSG
jgi:hypothetical protein